MMTGSPMNRGASVAVFVALQALFGCSGAGFDSTLGNVDAGTRASAGGRTAVLPSLDASVDASADGPSRDASAEASMVAVADSAPEAACEFDGGVRAPVSVGAARCTLNASWSAAHAIADGKTGVDVAFGSITPDELTMAWLSVESGTPTLHYADRGARSDPFEPAGAIGADTDYYAVERPALSPDGNRLVVVRKDRKGFAEYTRMGRFYAFDDTPSEASFGPLDNQALLFTVSEFFGDPIVSSDDRTLYYSRFGADQVETVFESTRASDVDWPIGTPVAGEPLLTVCGHRRRPTGVAADGLTLFYWDEASHTERATWRATLAAPFAGVVDLGARDHATPNDACSTLYFSARGADAAVGTDVFVSSSN